MSKFFGLVGLLAGFLLLCAISYHAWVHGQADVIALPADPYLENITQIHKLQQLGAVWSKEILRVKATPLADFDRVAQIIPKVRKLRFALGNSELTGQSSSPVVKNLLFAYLSLSEAQEEALERFKSGFAILRNSINYLPIAGRSVIAQAKTSKKRKVAGQISLLTEEILAFAAQPYEAAQQEANRSLAALEKQAGAYPKKLASAIRIFSSHARVLLTRSLPAEKLLQRSIDSRETDQVASELLRTYANWHQQQIDRRHANAQAMEENWVNSLPSIGAGLGALLLLAIGLYLLLTQSQHTILAASKVQKDQDEEALHHASLAAQGQAAGRMLGSIHKRINEFTPLITENTKQLKKLAQSMGNASSENSLATTMAKAIEQLGQGISKLNLVMYQLNDGLKPRSNRGTSDVATLLDQAIDASVAYGANVQSIKRAYGSLPLAHGPDGGLRMALIKVLRNSMQTTGIATDPCTVEISVQEEEGNIHIRIKDNGVGLEADKGEKVLVPFYERLFAPHQGSVSITSSRDTGTSVDVVLAAAST